jgi:hypothetical protein
MACTAGSTTDGLLHISKMLPEHREYVGNELVVTASEGEEVLVEVDEASAPPSLHQYPSP